MRDPLTHRVHQTSVIVRRGVATAIQVVSMALANALAFRLRFDGALPDWAAIAFWQTLPWLVAIRAFTFIPLRLYEGLWRYTSVADVRAVIGGVVTSSILFYAFVRSPLGPPSYPRGVFVIDAIVLTFALIGVRLVRRMSIEFARGGGKRVLIFGAGDAGELIVRDMRNDPRGAYQPIGFIDDDQSKVGLRIHRVPVLGTRNDLHAIVDRYHPDDILLAVPHADAEVVRSIVRSLEAFQIPIKTLPHLRDLIDGKVEVSQIRKLALEDLLARPAVGLDIRPVERLIAGRRVMVTGAGGSIGSELCRQIARLRPASIVMLDHYENTLHAISVELVEKKLSIGLHPVIADITDEQRLDGVFREYQPEIVFHAAAHKHVPLMEGNPCEAIKNNVRGTRLLVQAADTHGVDRFVMISTDKAVNPTSVMGASKRVAELIVQTQASGSGTSFSIVRFGNVLGSNGSVIPHFMDQISRGGPVTVTHPEMRRFFMLIPEAVQLVLHAASQADSGATYVLEMGEQVKVIDMARDMIRLSGLVPGEDVRIEIVGLRPGEKLYEELVGPDEEAAPSRVDKVLRVRSRTAPDHGLADAVCRLEAAALAAKTDDVLSMLEELAGSTAPNAEPMPVAAAVDARPAVHGERLCPACHTSLIHRSRVRNVQERIRHELSAKRSYRCNECGWRGWLLPQQSLGQSPVEPVAAPDLAALDLAVTSIPIASRAGFSPRNLH